MDKPAPTQGAQTLTRGLTLLRLLTHHHEAGLTMSEAARLAGLERSTAHRLLRCLVEAQFAEKDERGKRYRLGIHALQSGSAAGRKLPLVDRFRSAMLRLARTTGDAIYLMVRDGDEAICLHREDGPHAARLAGTQVGSRRLLGVGVGGLALLSSLADAEIDAILARNRPQYDSAGLTPCAIWRAVQETRRTGAAIVVDRIVPGLAGIGRAVAPVLQAPAAISVGTITPHFTSARRGELLSLLDSNLSQMRSAGGALKKLSRGPQPGEQAQG